MNITVNHNGRSMELESVSVESYFYGEVIGVGHNLFVNVRRRRIAVKNLRLKNRLFFEYQHKDLMDRAHENQCKIQRELWHEEWKKKYGSVA